MIQKEEADGLIGRGWIRVLMDFQAIAIREDVATKSLEELGEKLNDGGAAKVYSKVMLESREVQNPVKGIEKGFSQIMEIEAVVKRLDELAQIMVEYGPSAVQIMEPERIEVDIGEAQNIVNGIAEVMHKFAAAGIGGMIFVRGKE